MKATSKKSSSCSAYLTELVGAVMAYQDQKRVSFFQVTDRPDGEDNYLETSGSAALSYVDAKSQSISYSSFTI